MARPAPDLGQVGSRYIFSTKTIKMYRKALHIIFKEPMVQETLIKGDIIVSGKAYLLAKGKSKNEVKFRCETTVHIHE